MTNFDKKTLLSLVSRMDMYINPCDKDNIISFIHGFEYGTNNKCNFTKSLKKLLSEKYKIKITNDSWWGQIRRLAEKRSISWPMTFKQITIEIIGNEATGSNKSIGVVLKSKIQHQINKIDKNDHPWFNESWIEEWLSLCLTKNKWFKQLWTDREWKIIKGIDREVQAGDIFAKGTQLPTPQLIKLRDRFFSPANS